MIRLLVFFCASLFFNDFAFSATVPVPVIGFTVDRLPLQQVLMIFYDQCERRGLVLDPGLSKLDDPVSFKIPSLPCSQVRPLVLELLARSGLVIEGKVSFDLVKRVHQADERDTWQQLFYAPKFRDALDLADMSMIAVRKGSFAHQRKGPVQLSSASTEVPETGSNVASMASKPVDRLVFFGPPGECVALQALLARLDVPVPQVELRAGIYEFQSTGASGSAVNAAASLFNGRLTLQATSVAQAGGFVKVAAGGVDAALSLLDHDSRFKFVARPTVLAKDGEAVHFFAGQQVRVNGATVLDRNGNPIQSKETLSGGLTLDFTPIVRGEVVDVSLLQSLSDFVPGSDGALLKRDIKSRLVMQPGAVYVIGGLRSSRHATGDDRLFGLRIGTTADANDTELLLVLTVQVDGQPSPLP
jgi:type II secretory pathway component GspD/PulD (secretin)